MKFNIPLLALTLGIYLPLSGQEILFDKTASLNQVYLDAIDDDSLLPMNDLGVEFGYVLYQTRIPASTETANLELENVRDYAAVYVNGDLRGTVDDGKKNIQLSPLSDSSQLQLYVENIGRITYGPEITDNSKGLFGAATWNGQPLENWTMIPLNIRNFPINNLTFETAAPPLGPRFHQGHFSMQQVEDSYLDISGWGMGEVWINNQYLGSYWEAEKQQSLLIPASVLVKGNNEIVVFELKNNEKKTMKLAKEPIFK